MAALAADLMWRSPLTAKYHWALRVVGAVLIAAVIVAAGWKPISEEYVKEGGLTALSDFVYSDTFRLLLAAVLGGLIGNQIAPARPRLWRRREAAVWPNVTEWLSVPNAIDRFVDQGLQRKFIAAKNAADEARRAFAEVQGAAMTAPSGTDIFATLAGTGRGNLAWDSAFSKKYDAEQEETKACADMFEDLKRQLRNGTLAGRGVRQETDKLPEIHKVFDPPNWVGLAFDFTKIGAVNGGGHTYEMVEIGKREASR